MKTPPDVSDAEWRVMEVLWKNSHASAHEVIEAMAGESDWKPNTIRTLLTRLVKKRALRVDDTTSPLRYTPCFSREEHLRRESDSFLGRLFDGAAKGLLVHFAKSGQLTEADLKELKRHLKPKPPTEGG